MGGVNSICIGCSSKKEAPENHLKEKAWTQPDEHRSLSGVVGLRNSFRSHRRNQSATFTQLTSQSDDTCVRQSYHLVNINTATAEQLMTLPGVNRETASHIVDYRRQLHGFRRVEDLALVPGIGGDRLRLMKSEICVRDPQFDSTDGPAPIRKLNLNTANVFQIMKINGITQAIAERIVERRARLGHFKSVGDLRDIKGVDLSLFSALKNRFCVSSEEVVFTDGASLPASDDMSPKHQLETKNMSQFSDSQLCLISALRLFEHPYSRPPTTPFFGELAGKSVLRVASWNLHLLGLDKIQNPGVLEVICCTILENALSFVALQEITNAAVLSKICDELNSPTLPNVTRWSGVRGMWEFCSSETPSGRLFQASEYGAFIFNTKCGIQLKKSAFMEKTTKAFTRNPFLGHFVCLSTEFLIASIHLKAVDLSSSDSSRTQTEVYYLPELARALCDSTSEGATEGRNVILLGDFNLPPSHHAFDELKTEIKFSCLIDEFTNVSKENPEGSCIYDHIWASEQTLKVFAGHSAVIRRGLTHPLIPVDFKFGGPVSDHCPVYADFYVK